MLFRDKPEDHPYLSENEKKYILSERQEKKINERSEKIELGNLFKSKNVWLAMGGQYFASNFTFFFALTWLFPPHVKSEYQLETVEAGFYAAIPLVFGAFGNWFSGWLIDNLFKKGKWNASRRLPAIVGFVLAALGLVGSIYADDAVTAIIFVSMAIFGGADMTLPPSWAFCVDIGKEHSGAVSGTMNMAGNLGGAFLTALAFPYILEWTGSTNLFFVIGGAILNFWAIILWSYTQPEKRYFEF